MIDEKEKIRQRINKLLALANPKSNAPEGERSNARALADKLAAQHGLRIVKDAVPQTPIIEQMKMNPNFTVYTNFSGVEMVFDFGNIHDVNNGW